MQDQNLENSHQIEVPCTIDTIPSHLLASNCILEIFPLHGGRPVYSSVTLS